VKGFLKTLLFVLLWILLLGVTCAGILFACTIFDIPLRTGGALCAVLIALILAVLLIYRLAVRRRRRQQLQRIVTHEAGIADARPERRLLENRWAHAVSVLRASYLGRYVNPLYALPWYMVMGKSGSGKTSVISRCGLNSMLTDVSPQQGSSGTRNCDWFFFRNAVVLDTAGRYAVPQDEGVDEAEWREFLLQLAKYRRKEPLNGMIITVAADTLRGDGSRLLDDARRLRRRLDEIMRILGAKFPVYLMVTKLDLPAGMARFLEGLPEVFKDRCAGRIIQSPDKNELVPMAVQIEQAWHDILGRFRTLCLFRESGAQTPEPQNILAWEELKAMTPALKAFAEELFAENPYQETPFLRGIFLSSALRREAETRSLAFPRLDALVRRFFRTPENVRGMFLHDFFALVLPGDRNLYRPVAEYMRWRSSTRLIAYALMLMATFGLASVFFLSYQHTERVLHQASPSVLPAPGADMQDRLLAFEQHYRESARMEALINSRTPPSMGFNQGRAALNFFNDKLTGELNRSLLDASDRIMEDRRNRVTSDTSDRELFILAADLIWRFDLANAALQGKSLDDMLKIPAMPQGILSALGVGNTPLLVPAVAYIMAVRYHTMGADKDWLEQAMRSMRASLARLPELKPNSLQWLVQRAGDLSMLPQLSSEVFWPAGTPGAPGDPRLEPMYTSAGFKATLGYLDNLTMIVGSDGKTPYADEFLRWYAKSCADAWRLFASAFVQKNLTFAASSGAVDTMPLMSSSANPFFALSLRMDEELRVIRPYLDPVPPWMDDLALWTQALRLEQQAIREQHGELTLAERLRAGAQKLYSGIDVKLDAENSMRRARSLKLVTGIEAYLKTLRDLVPATQSDNLAFLAVQDAMPDEKNRNAATAALSVAKAAVLALRQEINPAQTDDSPVSMLSRAPLSFFTAGLINSAACRIQALWEGNVLAKAGSVSPVQLQQTLFAAQGGLARDFADKTLLYFLDDTLHGYSAQKLDDTPLPFTNEFLSFLSAGTLDYRPMPQEYAVTVDVVPVDVNDDALEKPHAAILSLSCARDKQELVNYNSPASRRFIWQRDGCGDTKLSVVFKSLTLDVLYAGENGFAAFLNDFQYGSKIFTPKDFPGQEDILKKLGVTEITLRYKFSGADAILRGTTYTPGTLPFVAAECRR
jgi:type VI secretion system protein ImpL